MKTVLIMTIEHRKPIPDLTDIAAGRVYTLDGVNDVTASIQAEPPIDEFDKLLAEAELQPDWAEAQAWAAEMFAGARPATKRGFWSWLWRTQA